MTDMTVALRVFADTQSAQTGLRTLAEGLRDMGVRAKLAAVDSADAALRSATAWTQGAGRITGAMTAVGAALEASVPDLSGTLGQQAADLTDNAMASADYARSLAEIRAMLNPLAAEAAAVREALVQVSAAEEMGAISGQEAAVITDRLSRALTEMEARAQAAGLPLRDLGPAGQHGATGIQQLIGAQTGLTRASEASIAATLRHGQMLDALKARFNPIFAATQRYEQELRDIAEAERLGAISAGEAAAARDRATASMAPVADDMQQVGASAGAASAYVANLGFQINDIGMMLAAGQNPLMLAIQQGSQVSQVFQQMQASGMAIGASLRTALMGMVSPLSLITMGAIAGGAALLQWATSGVAATLSLEDAMSDLSEGVSDYESAAEAAARSSAELREEFGDGAEAARELLTELAALDRWRAAGALATSSRSLEAQYGLRVQGRISATELSDMFGLSMFGRGRETRKVQIGSVIEGFDAVQAAAKLPDEDARIDAMADATARLRDAFAAAADASGDRSETERTILRALTDQVLAAGRLKEIRDSEARAHRDRLAEMQQGEDRATRATRPEDRPALSGEATRASWEARDDLGRQAAMAALVAQHGRDSLEVARAQVAEERRLYELALQKEAISDIEQKKRLAAWDLAKGLPALESQRRAEAEQLLATLQQEEAIQRAIAMFGEDSAEVARLRADQERAAFEATVATLGVSDELAAKLLAAWENARGLGSVDMESGIARARAEARKMADEIVRALGAAQALASQSGNSLEDAKLRWKYRDQPVTLAGALANARAGRQVQLPAGAEDRAVARVERDRAIDVGNAREQAEIEQRLSKWQSEQNKLKNGGGGGGGADARDTLAGLSKESAQLLRDVEIAALSVQEKVKAGLLSVADGEKEVASAKERAANQLADLIARLDRLGPAGKAAADAARGALKEMAAEAGKANEDIKQGMIRSFEDSFVRSLATGKDAMSSFADHVQTELARAFTQKFITPLITPLIDGIMGIFPFADGGVPDAPGLAEHRNTVLDRPTPFAMANGNLGIAGEAGPEAILPVVSGAGGQGVRATAPDGSETVLPLQRAADGKLGVAVPATAAPSASDPLSSPARAIQQMLRPTDPALAQYRDAIVTRPTPFAMPDGGLGIMGEADPEAILPVVSGAGGLGVRATAPDGSETVIPLQRAADGKLGVAVPAAAMTSAPLSAPARAIQQMLRPAAPAVTGADAILPLASGPRGRGVRATGPGGAAGVLPIGRGASGALAVQLPDVGAIVRRPSFFADGGVIGRLSAPARVPEMATGSGGGIRSAGVVIHNYNPAAKVEAREREGSDGMSFDVVIEQLESAMADRARRGVGSLSGVMGDTFGLGRVGR